jgi:hypothetical protein
VLRINPKSLAQRFVFAGYAFMSKLVVQLFGVVLFGELTERPINDKRVKVDFVEKERVML